MRRPNLQVRRLWRGDKGRLPTQLELPPLVYDGAGNPFAVSEARDELCLCNQSHLLLWKQISGRAQFHGAFPLSSKESSQYLGWGITSAPWGWIVLANEGDTLWRLSIDSRLQVQDRVSLSGFLRDYNVAPPLRVRLHKQDVYFADKETLVICDLRGDFKMSRACPYGFTLTDATLVLPSSEDELPTGIRSAELIASLPNRELRFWLSERYVKRANPPYLQTELVVSQGAKIEKQCWLNGDAGVIHELRVPSQIEWVEFSPSGSVYVLGWKYAGLKGSVGLWRLSGCF
ncbi:MAG: hypothetical protein P3X24_008460 [bacterium]|nr:hypothetical protein [bacterium]